jgi:hypothetical protein
MLKTIQRRMTVILIVSVLLQLFAGVTPVLAEGSSDLITEPGFVPMLAATLSPGEMTGATSATVTDYVYGNLLVNITEREIATPQMGDTAPTAGDNMIADYESGADITTGVAAGNYLQIYDVDMEKGAQIVAFYQAELTGEAIKEEAIKKPIEDIQEEPDQNSEEESEDEAGEDVGEGEEDKSAVDQLMSAELMAEGGYTYIDENGETKKTGNKWVFKINKDTHILNSGWYIVEGYIERDATQYQSDAIIINGDVHLILADNSHLLAHGFFGTGINVTGSASLTIYAQSEGDKMGSLKASGWDHAPSIGGFGGSCGDITINGGRISAKGYYLTSAIGGGDGGGGGNITINGGIVTASSKDQYYGAGIGGGNGGGSGNIIINGGTVTAIGGFNAAGIGGGNWGGGQNITINGGTVTATGGACGAGIGGGYRCGGGNITINDGTVTATGGTYGAGIGGGWYGAGDNVTISGGTIIATGYTSAGIGGGLSGTGGNVIVKNESVIVIATGIDGVADIGNGNDASGITNIKRGSIEGKDLTYVKLGIHNLPQDSVNKIYCSNGEVYEINSQGVVGFFIERLKDCKISLDPAGPFVNLSPGDVLNSIIILDYNYHFAKLSAGFGNALDFSANSKGRINVPFKDTGRNEYENDHTKIGGDSDFTISMWICPQGNEPYQTLFRQYGDGEDTGHLGLDFRFIKYNDDEGYLYFGFNKRDAGGWQNAFPWGDEASLANITKIPMNQWTHVALTKSGKSVMLYANGAKYYEMILDDLHYIAHAPLKNGNISIGGTPFVDQFFSGRMDEIQFWNTALTQDEIAAWVYREIDKKHPKYGKLVYYYKLNQSNGTIVIDSKGSNDGTLVNMTNANWVTSKVQEWAVNAGKTLNGRLVGSCFDGSSNNGTDWKLTFEIVEQTKKGTVTIAQDNQFVYSTIDRNQLGIDTFKYRVKDPNGNYSNTETVNINILPAFRIIPYIDGNGEMKGIEECDVSKVTPDTTVLKEGLYVAEGVVTIDGTVSVDGDVGLILTDNSSLEIRGGNGINVTGGNSLTIYSQSKGDNMGSLSAVAQEWLAAGIGGDGGSCGNITINGGRITVIGGTRGAGIGGGAEGNCGDIAINDGIVTAKGGSNGSGIGCGSKGYGSNVTITGGTVTATGGNGGAGIGSGALGHVDNVLIAGGTVTAMGGGDSAGIGGGSSGYCGNVTITGGTVTATGGSGGAGIGSGARALGDGCNVTIADATVTATGGNGGAGIGGGLKGDGGSVTIDGGTVIATGGSGGAGIGGGSMDRWNGNIIIKSHPAVFAIGRDGGADIGNGANGVGVINLRRDSIEGPDLTYVRLQFQGLRPNDTKKIIFNEEEYKINSDRLTGFFVERPTESLTIRIEHAGFEAVINPGDVQSSRITLNENDINVPVAGFGRALNFPANSKGMIIAPSNTEIAGNYNFTISMWICPQGDESYQTLFRQTNTLGASSYYGLNLDFRFIKYNGNEGYLYFGFESRGDGWQNSFPWGDETALANIRKIPINQWTHVALTKSDFSVILYVNGTKYCEMLLYGRYWVTPPSNSCEISIGGTNAVNQFFCGSMDEIQFWNTALTPDEIEAWMYREIDKTHPKYNHLVYYYTLSQISENTVIMDNKNSYNGTLINLTEANSVSSDILDRTVNAGETINGELIGSYGNGTSTGGTDWNLAFEIVGQAKKGTATITSDNKFEYQTNDMSQEGHDFFTYRVKGSDGKYSNIETVNLNIIPKTIQNWPPTSGGNSTGRKKSADTGVDILVNGKAEGMATATTTQEGDKSITTVVVDDQKVEKRLEQEGNNAVVTIPVMSVADVVIGTLSGQTVKNMASKDAVLEIKTGQVTYTLPASQINIDAVSEQIGKQVELKDIAVSIKISEPAEDTVKIALDTANKNNYQIIVKPIEFEITCSSGSKTVEVTKFNAYVERMIAIPEGVDLSKITTGVVLNPDGTFSHVPTAIIMIDAKYYAKINSLTNSTYSIIYSPKTFKDIEGHWAEKDINDMASRLIISGAGNDLFEPERSITRAEFSAVMVRALGLRPEVYKNNYFDVKEGEWYSEYISTASYYGLVSGYDDGTFKPDGNINRQEAMAILARAMGATKLGEELEIDASSILAAFNDNADVSGWAKDSVSKCVKTGVVTGRDNGRIAPLDNITRAETTIMVRRLLLNSDLINK